MVDLAVSLGLGEGLGGNAPLSRTIARLEHFDAARTTGDTISVRTALPDLPTRRLTRLSQSARIAHQHLATSILTPQREPQGPVPDPAVTL
jgi:hypothetical protein